MIHRDAAARRHAARRSAVSIAVLAALFSTAQAQTQSAGSLPAITISGSTDQGVKPTDASTGILGDVKIVDTPFSVSPITRKLIEDQQAQHYGDYLKNDPGVRVGNVPVGFTTIRGFQVSIDGYLYDGLPGNQVLSDGRYQLVGFDRVEVLKGASTFLYGSTPGGSIGGVINYIPKRPLDAPVRNASVGFISRSVFTADADLGNRFGGENQFGYRFNVAYKNGDQSVRDAGWNQKAATLAMDWRASRNLVFNAGVEYSENHYPRLQPFFVLFPGADLPKAPNGRRNISQKWDDFRTVQKLAYLRADWQIATDWSLSAQAVHAHSDRPRLPEARFGFITNALNTGDALLFSSIDEAKNRGTSYALTLRGKAVTGPVEHQLALSALRTRTTSRFSSVPTTAGIPTNIYNPSSIPEPADPGDPGLPPGNRTFSHSFAVSDVMKLSERWSLIGGLRRITIENEAYTAANGFNGPSETRTTPLLAVVFKPTSNSSLYVNYAEGFEQGGVAGVANANNGEQLPARETKQYEIGGKLDLGGLLLTAALFDMKRAGEFTNPVTTVLERVGSQRHRGLELIGTGQVTPNLSMVAGFTYLRPKLRGTGDPTTDGNDPAGVPRLAGNLYADFRILPGVFINGGIYAQGKQWFDNANTQRVPGYVRFDAGARYETKVFDKPTIVRFNIENLTDKNCYASALGGVLTFADPRTYKLSAQVGF